MSQCLDDEHEHDETEEDDIRLVESRGDSAKALEAPEQTLGLVAPLVQFPVILPGSDPIPLRRNHGIEATRIGQSAGVIVLVCPVHEQCRSVRGLRQPTQELPPRRRVMRVAGRAFEGNRCSGIRGNQMKSGVPAAAGLADGLRTVFFRAPVPSG